MKIATVSPMLESRPAILMSFPVTPGGAGAPIASASAFPPTTPINLPIIRLPVTIQVIAPVYVHARTQSRSVSAGVAKDGIWCGSRLERQYGTHRIELEAAIHQAK